MEFMTPVPARLRSYSAASDRLPSIRERSAIAKRLRANNPFQNYAATERDDASVAVYMKPAAPTGPCRSRISLLDSR